MSAMSTWVTSSSLRRSKASASEPPNSEQTSSGPSWAMPSMPTANDECVIVVDLHRHGHDRELGPDERDELPTPEQPVVARVAQGRDVDEDPAAPTAGGRGQPGSWASIAAMTSGASGSTWGAKRSTTSPVGEMRNFSKFQRMSPAVPSASAWVVSSA